MLADAQADTILVGLCHAMRDTADTCEVFDYRVSSGDTQHIGQSHRLVVVQADDRGGKFIHGYTLELGRW